MASEPRTALEVRFDEVAIAGRKVLGPIRLDVNLGEVVLLVGGNGSGKSVLMKSIMGIEAIGVGRVAVFGEDVDPPSPHVLRQLGVGYLPQHRVVFEDLTIEENLEVCRASGVRVTQDLVPSVLGARLRERAGSLSGGERQLLGMAMVQAASPRLMLLDEPTAALTQDASNRLLQRLLPTPEGNGAAVLLIEQRISDALRIASRVIRLENGRVAYSGPPSEFVFGRDPSSPRHGAVSK